MSERKWPLVGDRLAAIREARRISQAELARRVDVDQSTISRFEKKSGSNPAAHVLLGIARELGVGLGDLSDNERSIEEVLEDVRAGRLRRGTPTPEDVAVRVVRDWGPVGIAVEEFGLAGGQIHVQADLVEGVARVAVVRVVDDSLAPEVRSGEIVFIDRDATWRDGALHLIEHQGRVDLRWVHLAANFVRWTDPDGTPQQGTTSTVPLRGVAYAVQPPGRWLHPRR